MVSSRGDAASEEEKEAEEKVSMFGDKRKWLQAMRTAFPKIVTGSVHHHYHIGTSQMNFDTWVGRSPCLTHVTVNDNARWEIIISSNKHWNRGYVYGYPS